MNENLSAFSRFVLIDFEWENSYVNACIGVCVATNRYDNITRRWKGKQVSFFFVTDKLDEIKTTTNGANERQVKKINASNSIFDFERVRKST